MYRQVHDEYDPYKLLCNLATLGLFPADSLPPPPSTTSTQQWADQPSYFVNAQNVYAPSYDAHFGFDAFPIFNPSNQSPPDFLHPSTYHEYSLPDRHDRQALEDSLAEIEREYENERFEILRKEREQREYEQRQEARELRLTELRREIAGIRRWREIRTVRQNLRKTTIPQREPIVAEQVLNEHIDHEVSNNDDFEKRTEEPTTTTAPSIVSIARPRPRPRIRQRRRIRRVKRTARLSRSKPKLVPIQNFAPKNNLSSTPPRSSERWKATTTSTTRRLRFSPAMRRFQSPARRPRPPPMPPPRSRVSRLG